MRRSKAREGDQGEGDVVGAPMRYEMADEVAATARMRARAPGDAEGMAHFNFTQEHKFILAQERTFCARLWLIYRIAIFWRRRHHGRERCRCQLLTSAPIFASCTKAAAL
jgi:hypothetical protein